MSKSKAEKFRIAMDIMFNALILVLIFQVSTNCTWFLGSSNMSLQQANLSLGKQYVIDQSGNLVEASQIRWIKPIYAGMPDGNCSCINVTINSCPS